MRILIVDDETVSRSVLVHALSGEGYEISEVNSGRAALDFVRARAPDLILLDMQMPVMDGLETLSILNASGSTQNIPVIIVTAMSMDSTIAICLDRGAVDFVSKPVSPLVIRARVRGALNRSQRLPDMPPVSENSGKIIGFVGAKGGVGTSTIVVNMAVELAKSEDQIALVDLNSEYGSAAYQLGIAEPSQQAAEDAEADAQPCDLFEAFVEHELGIHVLECRKESYQGDLSPRKICDAIRASQRQFPFTFIDLCDCTSERSKAVLPLCHSVVLVVDLEPSAIIAAISRSQQIQEAIVEECRTEIIVSNRAQVISQITLKDVRDALTSPVIGVVPADPGTCMMANSQQIPAVLCQPDTMIAGSLQAIAQRFKTTIALLPQQ